MSLGEFDIIDRYFIKPHRAAVPNGDDAAVFDVPPHNQLVQCMDTLVAGRHFFSDTPAHAIGYKSLAVNLSDLAAMGATPQSALLGLTLPKADDNWLQAFAHGFFDCATEHGVSLIGGDTTQGPLTISVCANGTVPTNQAIRRNGARAGDLIVVSGDLGAAAYTVEHRHNKLSSSLCPHLARRLDYPSARVSLGARLLNLATACIDLSDGPIADIQKLLTASGLGGTVHMDSIPLHSSLPQFNSTGIAMKQLALSGGDDYELCFCLPPKDRHQLQRLRQETGCNLTVIGYTSNTGTLSVVDANLQPVTVDRQGYDHFTSP